MIDWVLKEFYDLSSHELYAILQLRNEVFVVEQDCVYQDADNKDQSCYHFMGWRNEKLVAYTRILPPGLSYTEPSIGRVVVSMTDRSGGIGRILMERTLEQVNKLYGDTPIKIEAQLYLLEFYRSLGFDQTSEVYLEDNIEHIEMVKL